MRMRSGFDPDFLCVLILVLGSLGSSLNMQFIFSFHRENLKSSLEESLKNLEIVKSRCHSCLEYSEKGGRGTLLRSLTVCKKEVGTKL